MDILNFRVSPDSKSLELWVRVPAGENYKKVKIDRIAISNNYHSVFPDKEPNVYIIDNSEIITGRGIDPGDPPVGGTDPSIPAGKEFSKIIPMSELGMLIENTGMFFLYVLADGVPADEVPCCCFNALTIACAINHYPVYNQMLKIINSFEDKCNYSEDRLLDLFLKKQMITQSVELCDYPTAVRIFNDLYKRELDKGNCLNTCNHTFPKVSSPSGCKTC